MRPTLVIAYLAAMAGLFGWLFSMDASDDYAGWVPAVVGAQLPAALALLRAPRERSFGLGRAFAFAVPAGLASAATVFLLAVRLGAEVKADGLAWLLGVMAWSALSLPVLVGVYARILVRTPGGAARVLRAVTAAGALSVATVLSFRGLDLSDGIAAGIWIIAAIPLAWVLPLWLLKPR